MECVYVVLLKRHHDGSGEEKVLGVYGTSTAAEARCYRTLRDLGYDQPIEVIETVVGVDL